MCFLKQVYFKNFKNIIAKYFMFETKIEFVVILNVIFNITDTYIKSAILLLTI